MADEIIQPSVTPKPAQISTESQFAPIVDLELTQSLTEPVLVGTTVFEALNMPPVATEAPTPLDTPVSAEILVSEIPTLEPQNLPLVPVLVPVEPQPNPAPVSQTTPVKQVVVPATAPTPRSFLQKALDAIQFRKRAKLEKIIKFIALKGSATNDQIEKLLHVSDATATRYLSQLVKEGRLKRTGPNGNAKYEVI